MADVNLNSLTEEEIQRLLEIIDTKVIADRIQERFEGNLGTADIVLDGVSTAIDGYFTFNSMLNDGDQISYVIESVKSSLLTTGQFEIGVGVWDEANTTLKRQTVLFSSNRDEQSDPPIYNKVNFTVESGGFIKVWNSFSAQDINSWHEVISLFANDILYVNNVLSNIETARTTAIGDITDANTASLEAISTANTTSLGAISSANTASLGAISSANTASLGAISSANTASLTAIGVVGDNPPSTSTGRVGLALTAISSANTASLEAISTAKEDAQSTISSDLLSARSTISTDLLSARSTITSDTTNALGAISSANTASLGAISSANTASLTAITTARTNATNSIGQVKETPQTSTGAVGAALVAIENAENSSLATINDAVDERLNHTVFDMGSISGEDFERTLYANANNVSY